MDFVISRKKVGVKPTGRSYGTDKVGFLKDSLEGNQAPYKVGKQIHFGLEKRDLFSLKSNDYKGHSGKGKERASQNSRRKILIPSLGNGKLVIGKSNPKAVIDSSSSSSDFDFFREGISNFKGLKGEFSKKGQSALGSTLLDGLPRPKSILISNIFIDLCNSSE
ncbi:hypothetical protein QYF36_003050 [Acer negundo]|nr:hypothetical protein QYF36_003050 [Acer negundo]